MKSKNTLHRKLFAPWKYILLYIIGTLIVFSIGPWSYRDTNFIILYSFMIFFLLLSSFFYFIGISKVKYEISTNKSNIHVSKFFKGIIIFAFCVSTYMVLNAFITKGNPFSGSLFTNMAEAYTKTSTIKQSDTDRPLWFFINFSPLIYPALILGLFYYKELKKKYRMLVLLTYIQLFLYFILFVGTQKTLGDLIVIILSVFITNMIKNPIKFTRKVSFVVLAVIVVLFFSSILMGRIVMWSYSFSSHGLAQVDMNNWIIKIFPEGIDAGFAFFIYYITHGYYGLSLSLQLPFKWSYGLGSSFEIRDLASRFLGLSSLVDGTTYPERMQAATGWDAYANWHTIFPWIASDFTFIGAILIVSFSAYLYAKAWKEVLLKNKWQSILMFTMLNIQWVYLPASNQLFQTRTTLTVFVFTVIVWIFRNKNIKIRH